MIFKLGALSHLWAQNCDWKKAEHIEFNDQELNSSLVKIDIQLCST